MKRLLFYILVGSTLLSSCHKDELEEMMKDVVPSDTVDIPSKNVIKSLKIESLPTKTQYFLHESLNLNGFSVQVIYSNGTSKVLREIPQEWLKGFDNGKPAKQLRISLEPTDSMVQQVSASFTIDVLPLVVNENEIVEVVDSEFETIEIPEGIRSIKEEAFGNIHFTEKIVLPSSLEKIGTYAFYAAKHLQMVDLSKTALEDIPSGTFESCANLTAVLLPASLRKIGGNAFYGTTRLQNLIIPYGVEEIGNTAFSNSGIVSVQMPNSVCQINRSFYKCPNLKEIITFGEIYRGKKEERNIAGESFQHCPNLETLQIPSGVKRIGISVLGKCKVKSLKIPNTVEYIEFNAFGNASSLEKVELSERTKTEDNAFPSSVHVTLFH